MAIYFPCTMVAATLRSISPEALTQITRAEPAAPCARGAGPRFSPGLALWWQGGWVKLGDGARRRLKTRQAIVRRITRASETVGILLVKSIQDHSWARRVLECYRNREDVKYRLIPGVGSPLLLTNPARGPSQARGRCRVGCRTPEPWLAGACPELPLRAHSPLACGRDSEDILVD